RRRPRRRSSRPERPGARSPGALAPAFRHCHNGPMEWTGARYADSPSVTASTRIAAAPTRVWRWVCDITVMPELSTELQSVEWTGPERRPVLGATFVGHNHNPAIGSWQAPAQIIACDENTEFAWAVGDRDNPAAIWRFRLAADDA